ncbi:MAG: tRNA-dihydrouridine synthase family protein, partial [Muribaculaceae bacterium]|nr:tRNA-dihydrouridine synthase family protein [Muribaculaceae bacterium]
MMHIAPVQGHTDAAWRHFHKMVYGGSNIYYTPFIRLEKGEFRKHDLKDFLSELNNNHEVVPQVIFRNMEELTPLLSGLVERDAKRIDLNTGCPFPLQTARGRGAAFVGNIEEYKKIPDLISQFPEVEFSVKMRLGLENSDEWKGIIPVLNDISLHHVALHPRIAKQQYGGDLNIEAFEEFLSQSKNKVVFNGEIKTPTDISERLKMFPSISGVMTGRGILGRPSLLAEYEEGEEWNKEKRLDKMMEFHNLLFDHYSSQLCGDHQILSKIKPFWEYSESELGRKSWKAINKASN